MPIYPSSTTAIDNDTIKENSTGEIYADAANIAPNMIDKITIQQNSSGTIYTFYDRRRRRCFKCL